MGSGYEWGGSPMIFARSCNAGRWRVSRPCGAAASEQTFRLGVRLAALAVVGATGCRVPWVGSAA